MHSGHKRTIVASLATSTGLDSMIQTEIYFASEIAIAGTGAMTVISHISNMMHMQTTCDMRFPQHPGYWGN